VKIPDTGAANRRKAPCPDDFSYGVRLVFFGGLGLTGLILFLKNLRSEAARRPMEADRRWVWGRRHALKSHAMLPEH